MREIKDEYRVVMIGNGFLTRIGPNERAIGITNDFNYARLFHGDEQEDDTADDYAKEWDGRVMSVTLTEVETDYD